MNYEKKRKLKSKDFLKFIIECQNGNLDEVRRWLNRYETIKYFEESIPLKKNGKVRCSVCICVYSKQNEVLNELLKRGFNPNGYCSSIPCALKKSMEEDNIDSCKALIRNGCEVLNYDLRYVMEGDDYEYYEYYLEDIVRIMSDIIKENENQVNLKPAK